MRIAIVFNPYSGPRTASTVLGDVVAALAARNHELDILDRHSRENVEQTLAERASELDAVIAIGGDGTLNSVVNGVMCSGNTTLPIAFVPTGRGKDTSRTLPSWTHHGFADDGFEHATTTTIDVMHIQMSDGTSRYGVNVSNIGLGAHAAAIANRMPRWFRTMSYVAGAGAAIVPPRPFRLCFTVDGESHVIENALLFAVCNGRAFGGGIYIAPEAACTDGMLDLVVAHNAHLGDLARQLPKLKSGVAFEHPALSRYSGANILIEPVTNRWYEVDGEPLESQPISIRALGKHLHWISPA